MPNNDLIIDGENMLDGVEKESQTNTEPKDGIRSINSTNELFGQKKYTINSSLSPLIPSSIPNNIEFNQLAAKLKEGSQTPLRKKLGISLTWNIRFYDYFMKDHKIKLLIFRFIIHIEKLFKLQNIK